MTRAMVFLLGVGLSLVAGGWYFTDHASSLPATIAEPKLWQFSDARPLNDIYANEPQLDSNRIANVADHAAELAGWNATDKSSAARPNPIRVAPADATDELPPELLPQSATAMPLDAPRYADEPEAPRVWTSPAAQPLSSPEPAASPSLAEQRYAELFGEKAASVDEGNPLRGGMDAPPRSHRRLSFESPSDIRPVISQNSTWRDNPLR